MLCGTRSRPTKPRVASVLLTHRDVETTHIISAVLNINQTMDEGWPPVTNNPDRMLFTSP